MEYRLDRFEAYCMFMFVLIALTLILASRVSHMHQDELDAHDDRLSALECHVCNPHNSYSEEIPEPDCDPTPKRAAKYE